MHVLAKAGRDGKAAVRHPCCYWSIEFHFQLKARGGEVAARLRRGGGEAIRAPAVLTAVLLAVSFGQAPPHQPGDVRGRLGSAKTDFN